MHDGDPIVPWSSSGCMTHRAESKKARNVKTSNARGDRTFGERGKEREAITIKQGKTRIESKCAKCGAPSLSLRRNGFAFTDAADSRNGTSNDARA